MVTEHDFAVAVRRLLPVLNIRPESLSIDPGLVTYLRRDPPSYVSLGGVRRLLVYVGTLAEVRRERAADQAAAAALESLSPPVRQECDQLLVVWEDTDRVVLAAVYEFTRAHDLAPVSAMSWTDPSSWSDPMIDVSKPLDVSLDETLRKIADTVARQPNAFAVTLARKLDEVEVALRSAGGEGQDVSDRPEPNAPPSTWSPWLRRFELSVRDEWNRVRGHAAGRVRIAAPTTGGRLSGVRVFLSYARPDSTRLARPVLDALRAQGADVWFDQDEPLEQAWLDDGLAAIIERCDAYVLCASDEFFERGGYATQEVAWAKDRFDGYSPLRSIVVVTEPGTILPTIANDWPVIDAQAVLADDGRRLAAAIEASHPPPSTVANAIREQPPLPALAPEPDAAALLARARHRQRLYAIPTEVVTAIATTTELGAYEGQVADNLREVGAGLDWDGHLVVSEEWPDDSLIRAFRWLLGCSRAIANVRWSASGDLDDLDDVRADIELLAIGPNPLLTWPDATGWDDEDRRNLLRFHLGTLRLLQELLTRGLFGALLTVPAGELDRWLGELPGKRRECIDALVDLRIRGRLSWRGQAPTWDVFYGHWFDFLSTAHRGSAPVPAKVHLAISARIRTLSAAAAGASWTASRTIGTIGAQTWHHAGPMPATYQVWIDTNPANRPRPSPGRSVAVGVTRDGVHWVIQIAWWGFDVADGESNIGAPESLVQSPNPSSA